MNLNLFSIWHYTFFLVVIVSILLVPIVLADNSTVIVSSNSSFNNSELNLSDYSLNHTLDYSLNHTLDYSLNHSLDYSLNHTLNYSLNHSLNYSLNHSLIESLLVGLDTGVITFEDLSNLSSFNQSFFNSLISGFEIGEVNLSLLNLTNTSGVLALVEEISLYRELNGGLYYDLEDHIDNEPLDNSQVEQAILQTPLEGEIYTTTDNKTNFTSFYVELGDFEEIENLDQEKDFEIELLDVEQNIIIPGLPTTLYQKIIITNLKDEQVLASVNLWNYAKDLILNAVSIKVLSTDADLLSEQPMISLNLEPFEIKELIIVYEYPMVVKEIICEEKTLNDFLPVDAQLVRTEIPLNTIVDSHCSIKVYYDESLSDYEISIDLDDISEKLIKSIYYVEENRYLNVTDNLINLAEQNNDLVINVNETNETKPDIEP